MPRTVVIKGRVVEPHTVELETALPDQTREVEVVARVTDRVGGSLSDYVRGLPRAREAKTTSTGRFVRDVTPGLDTQG